MVIDRGSLADAMRATMSLPLVFPPVELDGRVLVDGGAMNNVPANVVRGMGADRVVAINVGELDDKDALSFTILSVAGSTLDAMTRAATKRALASADVVINVPLESFGSLDWRRSAELIDEGYKAAEAMREQLLPLAVDDEAYGRWREQRQERRLRELPPVAFVDVEGFAPGDAARLRFILPRYVGSALDVVALERDLEPFTGLDRYQTVTWRPALNADGAGRARRARTPEAVFAAVPDAGPQRREHEVDRLPDHGDGAVSRLRRPRIGFRTARRRHARLRSRRWRGTVRADRYKPVFFAPSASWTTSTFNVFADDEVAAQYGQSFSRVGLLGGVNLGARSDVRAGFVFGRVDSDLDVGDTGLGTIEGSEASFRLMWRLDTQDSPVVPQGGTLSSVALRYQFDGPDRVQGGTSTPEAPFTQFSGAATRFWSVSGRNRVFVHGEAGTSSTAIRCCRTSSGWDRRFAWARSSRESCRAITTISRPAGSCARSAACRTFSAAASSRAAGSKTAMRSTTFPPRRGAPTSVAALSPTRWWDRSWWPRRQAAMAASGCISAWVGCSGNTPKNAAATEF